MKKLILTFIMTIPVVCFAQFSLRDRLNVFVDCSNTWCDMTFVRTEITTVNFSLDRVAADIHVLITSADAGGGGDQFNMIFYGQNKYAGVNDTLRFTVSPIATDFERRDLIVKYLKLGLAPSVAKTKAVEEISIGMKTEHKEGESNQTVTDKWNYWVYRISIDGSFEGDQVYKQGQLNNRISISRTTDKSKIGYIINAGINRSKTEYDTVREIVDNHNYFAGHYYIKSLGPNWGAGYDASYSLNTFSNNKGRAYLRTALEYNFFPYKDVNTKLFTISYGPFIQHNSYFDSTIFNKKNEYLTGHMLQSSLTLNQKWGNIGIGIAYRNFFHDFKLLNTGANVSTNVRITGGLSFYIEFNGNIIRDQIFLAKGEATPEDVLTRRRQLGTSYSFETWFGLTYRFGSILNNFVNPRFDGPGNWIF